MSGKKKTQTQKAIQQLFQKSKASLKNILNYLRKNSQAHILWQVMSKDKATHNDSLLQNANIPFLLWDMIPKIVPCLKVMK